ncbi:hypothetical protein [Ideonella paludis]|uniref:hypothetical protein n=1 Tax=Ideonella paludis TaxID=1233411 RepID=UPI00362EBAB1
MTPSSSLQGAGSGFGDVRGLELLKQRAAQDPKAVTREAAKQFEAIFMQELLKSMRNATLAEDPSPTKAPSWAMKCWTPNWPPSSRAHPAA